MLNRDPRQRISAKNLLKHKWFNKTLEESSKNKYEEEKNLTTALRNLQNFEADTTLQKAVLSYIASQEIDPQTEAQLRTLFTTLDKDGNGQISKQELEEGYEKMYGGIKKAKTLSKKVMAESDVNKNGCIDYNGFSIFLIIINRIFDGKYGK